MRGTYSTHHSTVVRTVHLRICCCINFAFLFFNAWNVEVSQFIFQKQFLPLFVGLQPSCWTPSNQMGSRARRVPPKLYPNQNRPLVGGPNQNHRSVGGPNRNHRSVAAAKLDQWHPPKKQLLKRKRKRKRATISKRLKNRCANCVPLKRAVCFCRG